MSYRGEVRAAFSELSQTWSAAAASSALAKPLSQYGMKGTSGAFIAEREALPPARRLLK